ncbi:septal ring lytic transglycosylase RlpA family protein [Leptolyngbya ohadii]|uniref:septal ring lytic transglycosylase RlpA family protein n=1 Tax=Leptolyngbya ohadii TaxID=1962290 RepID=UPI001CED3078|nr:septal ring lytic transglycosylase RlpA family protein [Leptolyngbya ohadii]
MQSLKAAHAAPLTSQPLTKHSSLRVEGSSVSFQKTNLPRSLTEPFTEPSRIPTASPTSILKTAVPNSLSQSLAGFVNPMAPKGQLPSILQPTFDLIQTHSPAAPDYPVSGTPSYHLIQLVTNLSRWTRGISEALRLTTPLVTVVQINPPPLNIDRWNMLSLNAPDIQSAEAADLPRTSCLGEEAEAYPTTLVSLFQVQVRGKPIAEFPLKEQAERFAERLRQVMQMDHFDPQTLTPVLLGGTPGGRAGQTPLFWVEPELSTQLDRSGELLAITWINNLRKALNVPKLDLIDAQQQMHDLIPTDDRLKGTASWYGPYFHGRITATGEVFDQAELTAAHPTLPFDTYLKVTNLETGKAVVVRINDRGPYFEDRSLDLSREAARCLNSEISGVVPYEAVIMKRSSGIFDAPPADTPPAIEFSEPSVEETAVTQNSDGEAIPQGCGHQCPVDSPQQETTSEADNPVPQ